MKVFAAQGTHETIGVEIGRRLSGAIKHNVSLREHSVRVMGMEGKETSSFVRQYVTSSSKDSLKLMEG